ncbi:MAG: FAD binding domain-containing protein [Ignavibacteria bacterium]|nr:FAD binding domain-containing protein [Ignavibacteria bacterium]
MDAHITFYLNSDLIDVTINPSITVLDFLRGEKHLTGTKEGCREGDCGACTVLLGSLTPAGSINYKSVNSCLLPIAEVYGKHVVSIEGLNDRELNLIQHSMLTEGGTQCGFCTPGFIMSMTNYFINNPEPTLEKGIAALDGNICRCTGYAGIKRALENVISRWNSRPIKTGSHVSQLIASRLLPGYFAHAEQFISTIPTLQPSAPAPRFIAGGTDLFVQQWEALLTTDVSFINHQNKESIRETDIEFILPGNTTVEEFISHPGINSYLPGLADQLQLFGSTPIRNRATIAGNIVNASPIADMANILMALGATIELQNGTSRRTLPFEKLYAGYKSLHKDPEEIISSVIIAKHQGNARLSYEKISRRMHLDIASVNSSLFIRTEGNSIVSARLSAGGVGPIPMFLEKTSEFLNGKEISASVMHSAIELVKTEIAPITDARGSKEYKQLLLCQLVKAHFIKLFPELIPVEEVV